MSDAAQTLQSWVRGFREFAGSGPGMAKQVAGICKRECDATIARGESLDGDKWAPLKKGGGQALRTAAHDVSASASGTKITIILKGGPVFSQYGTGRQEQRAILPTRGMPKKLGSAIGAGIVDMGAEFMTRGGRHDRGAGGNPWNATASIGAIGD